MENSDKKSPSRWTTLVAGCIMFLFTGIIYAWSIFSGPFRADFNWNSAQLGVNFTLIMACFCIGGLIGSKVTNHTSEKTTIKVSAILCLAGYMLCSFITAKGILMLYVSYGVIIGIGVGMSYNAILGTIVSRFKDRKGFASGLLLMGFGCSTLIMGNLAEIMFNSPLGWRNTYRIVGTAMFVALIAGSRFMIAEKSPEKEDNVNVNNEVDYTTRQMVSSPAFWLFFIIVALSNMIGTGAIGHSSYIAQESGVAMSLAPLIVGFQSVCNGLGRLAIGTMLDRYGRFTAMMADALCFATACVIMLVALSQHAAVMGIAGLLLLGFSYGGMPTLTSSVTAECFGTRHYTDNFGVANMSMLPASLGASIVGALQTKSGSYTGAFVFFIGIIATVFILNVFFNREAKKISNRNDYDNV